MLLLLDTHVLLTLAKAEDAQLPSFMKKALRDQRNASFASVVSLWEIALKHRLGKLPLPYPLEEWPGALAAFSIALMDFTPAHALSQAEPLPETRDPFDRMLLAICQVGKMRLVSLDRSLIGHPLALRPPA